MINDNIGVAAAANEDNKDDKDGGDDDNNNSNKISSDNDGGDEEWKSWNPFFKKTKTFFIWSFYSPRCFTEENSINSWNWRFTSIFKITEHLRFHRSADPTWLNSSTSTLDNLLENLL